jgi:hypothetical protein
MFAQAADDIGAPTIAKRLRRGMKDLAKKDLEERSGRKFSNR